MDKYALLHLQDSPYCFPIDTDTIVIRLRTKKDDVKKVELLYENKYIIGTKQNSFEMEKAYSSDMFDWYEARIKLKDTRLAYVFRVYDAEESFYFSEDGPTESYNFTLGYYNFFQYPYINEADIVRPVEWMKNAVFYQIFVDRFNRGDFNKADSYINISWGDKVAPKSFAGGDLKGITEKLPYLAELGITALYLTPVFTSVSNHKYDIEDYYNIDPMFGTNDDLKELVNKAHSLGIKVVLDAVFNHVSERLSQFRDVVEKGRDSKYYDWFIIHGNKPVKERRNYETFASCSYMPKLNTSNPDVQKYLTDIATYYIREYDTDGWRLDVADEISQDFWRIFRTAVKTAKNDAVIIGENWHDAYRNLRGDQHDSIMNYAFTKVALDYFSYETKNAEGTAHKMNELLMRNKEGVNKMMLNLLDSHDTDRFFTCVKENRALAKQALTMLFFYQGTPCIYYGTEVLLPGGYDPDCRRCMPWDKTGENGEYADVYQLIKKLAAFRKKEPLGDGIYRYTAEDDMLVMTCKTDAHTYKLIINHTAKQRSHNGLELKPESFALLMDNEVLINE